METVILLKIIWLHLIGDFLFQSDKIAINKSSSFKYLGIHCLIYSLPLLLISPLFAAINSIFHFVIDFCSSQLTTYFYKNKQRHWFFVTIGFDQAIHFTILILSYQLLGI